VREEPRGAQADAADHQHLEDQAVHPEDQAARREDPADAADHRHLADQAAHPEAREARREGLADAADHQHLADRAARREAREVAVGRLLREDRADHLRRVGHRHLGGRRGAEHLEVRRLACRAHLASQPWRRSPDRP
jgi:hypothetical protein